MTGFEANLQEFTLIDILQFLLKIRKTGMLKVEGESTGEIYLKDGLVIHAANATGQGIEALTSMSFAASGKVSFEPGIEPKTKTISEDVGKLTENIEKRQIEFQEIKKKLPPMDTILAKSTKELKSSVALRKTDWQILALIDGKRNLFEVIEGSKVAGYEAMKTIVWLKEKGLIYEPMQAERIMSTVVRYLNLFLTDFGTNGLNWLRRWAEINPDNKAVVNALNINEVTMEIKVISPLDQQLIEKFFHGFDEFVENEGPKIYGKLLFKKKFENFKEKLVVH